MEKWFIKTFKQRKTNFMSFLQERISPEQIIQRNWSYKIATSFQDCCKSRTR